MFSVIFPGQGSQIVGMGNEFFDKFDYVKKLFKEADETLSFSLGPSIIILDSEIPKASSASKNNSLTILYLSKKSFPMPIT